MTKPGNSPIFVVGAPRSGTTLLRYMLCGHPRIYIPPESNFIAHVFGRRREAVMRPEEALRALKRIKRYRGFFRDWRGNRPDFAGLADRLPELTPSTLIDAIYRLYAAQFGAERWGDKTPIYTTHVDLIAEMFPSAQFIHIIRDGRDVALSMMRAYRKRRFFYIDMFYAARSWRHRVRSAMASGARLGPFRYHQLTYEQLTADPERELAKICAFLGETYVAAMAHPEKVASTQHFSAGIHANTREPVTTARAGNWRTQMSRGDLRLFQTVAGDLLEELGYGLAETGPMSVAEWAHLLLLQSKYALIEAGRRAAKAAGMSDPKSLLDRSFRAVLKST